MNLCDHPNPIGHQLDELNNITVTLYGYEDTTVPNPPTIKFEVGISSYGFTLDDSYPTPIVLSEYSTIEGNVVPFNISTLENLPRKLDIYMKTNTNPGAGEDIKENLGKSSTYIPFCPVTSVFTNCGLEYSEPLVMGSCQTSTGLISPMLIELKVNIFIDGGTLPTVKGKLKYDKARHLGDSLERKATKPILKTKFQIFIEKILKRIFR